MEANILNHFPIGSMCSIFTDIWFIFMMVNVRKYNTVDGSYLPSGVGLVHFVDFCSSGEDEEITPLLKLSRGDSLWFLFGARCEGPTFAPTPGTKKYTCGIVIMSNLYIAAEKGTYISRV